MCACNALVCIFILIKDLGIHCTLKEVFYFLTCHASGKNKTNTSFYCIGSLLSIYSDSVPWANDDLLYHSPVFLTNAITTKVRP